MPTRPGVRVGRLRDGVGGRTAGGAGISASVVGGIVSVSKAGTRTSEQVFIRLNFKDV